MDEVFGLYLPEYSIPAPVPQTKMVQIIGHDGDIDLSNAYGETRYQSRKWTLSLKNFNPSVNWHTLSSDVNNAIHGKRLDFVFDDDPDYYWTGRFSVKDYISSRGEGTLKIEIVSDPYKMKQMQTVKTLNEQGTIELMNEGRKTVIPEVSSVAGANIEYTINGVTYNNEIEAGATVIIPTLILYQSEAVTVELLNANEDVTFRWREGSL